MKKFNIFTLMLALAFIGYSFKIQVNEAQISFEKTSHDFGTVKQNDKVEYEFKFTNKGTAPLIITDVVKTCGCTTPEWPKDKPIKAGETSSIIVKYDSKRVGPFNKEVVVKSNDPVHPELRLRISGTVEAVEGGGAPIRTNKGEIPGGN